LYLFDDKKIIAAGLLCLFMLLNACTHGTEPVRYVQMRPVQADCETFCENSADVEDVDACKEGCRWMRYYADPLMTRPFLEKTRIKTDDLQNCCDAGDEAFRICIGECADIMNRDLEAGIFKFRNELEKACFDLNRQ